jgi:hypothetical protein
VIEFPQRRPTDRAITILRAHCSACGVKRDVPATSGYCSSRCEKSRLIARVPDSDLQSKVFMLSRYRSTCPAWERPVVDAKIDQLLSKPKAARPKFSSERVDRTSAFSWSGVLDVDPSTARGRDLIRFCWRAFEAYESCGDDLFDLCGSPLEASKDELRMAIVVGSSGVLTQRANQDLVPASLEALYEIALLDDDQIEEILHLFGPDFTVGDVRDVLGGL